MTDLNTIIDHLTLGQAQSILRTITAHNQSIAEEILELALAQHTAVSWEDIAYGLFDELEQLEPEEVWDRAGVTRDGYVEPHEAAEEMIDEVVSPYLTELKKVQALGMHDAASEICKGLIAGFHRFAQQSTSAFKDWAGDGPRDFAESVVDAWKEDLPSDEAWQDIKEFNEIDLRGWLTYSLRSKV